MRIRAAVLCRARSSMSGLHPQVHFGIMPFRLGFYYGLHLYDLGLSVWLFLGR